MKNNVSKIFSAMSKLFRRAGQTDNSSGSLPTPTPKNVEFLPNSQELSPRISRIFPELDSPSPKIKEVQNVVLSSQRCEALPRSKTNKKLCQDIASISPDLTKLSPEVNTLSPITGNMRFDGSELCLKKKRNRILQKCAQHGPILNKLVNKKTFGQMFSRHLMKKKPFQPKAPNYRQRDMKYPRRMANQAQRVLYYLPSLKNCFLNRLRCRRLGTNCLSCLVNRVPVDKMFPQTFL